MAGGTFGMGVAVGDYDNDGWPDLFVTAYGQCILYQNNRDGTLRDVTDKAGLAQPRLDHQRRMVRLTTTTAGSICSCAVLSTTGRRTSSSAATTNSADITTAFRGSLRAQRTFSITTTATARLPK